MTPNELANSPMTGLDRVADWMSGLGLGAGPLQDATRLRGGTQNVMVRFRRDGRDYVLRRGPEHLRPRSNDVIRREFRLLEALGRTTVPHARLIAACSDESVLGGAVFYLMEPVDGFNVAVELPEPHRTDPAVRKQMAYGFVDALALLGGVDHQAVGLGDFGRPDGFLERQVGRWLAELATYDEVAEYPGPAFGPVEDVARWLERHRPRQWRPGILHGDYHLSNVMFSRTAPEVAAIVDWEMCTIGDPLLDLGWVLATRQLSDVPEFGGLLFAAGGLPSGDQLVERYARRSDRSLEELDWYVVLACFKLGILLEGTWVRALAGRAPYETGARLHAWTGRLFEHAQSLIDP
ncbi:phosphotransferase family protein [Nocardioides carbamazepini]|uniref:phosphotransferase family protein n=1 Tax=Nocardioides carbamazepini TaxID=2854259 RepID=UPI00214A761E|nr:phosphotransferase family protein [Nocardioides carbamazepini]MCR1784914.1 phosphotransferase family protein [Nocardioides carbamazepini]